MRTQQVSVTFRVLGKADINSRYKDMSLSDSVDFRNNEPCILQLFTMPSTICHRQILRMFQFLLLLTDIDYLRLMLIFLPSCMKLWSFVSRWRQKNDRERHTFEDYWKRLGPPKECGIHTFESNWMELPLIGLRNTISVMMLAKCPFWCYAEFDLYLHFIFKL